MPSDSPRLPPMPTFDVPIMLANGTLNPVWFTYLSVLDRIVRRLQEEIP